MAAITNHSQFHLGMTINNTRRLMAVWLVSWVPSGRRLMCWYMCPGSAAGSGLSQPVFHYHSLMIGACIANRT